jgi:exonuclease-1
MGIKGLFPYVQSALVSDSLESRRNQTAVIDAQILMYKAINVCQPRKYWSFFESYIKVLTTYDIKPIFVFDGQFLPVKADVCKKRAEARNKYLKLAAKATSEYDKIIFARRSCRPTPFHVQNIITVSISYLVLRKKPKLFFNL